MDRPMTRGEKLIFSGLGLLAAAVFVLLFFHVIAGALLGLLGGALLLVSEIQARRDRDAD